MTTRSRAYLGEGDFQRVRTMLIENHALPNWDTVRWEVFRYGGNAADELAGTRRWEADVRLWETDAGKLVGVINPELQEEVFLQTHPDYRHIEDDMLAWAEQRHCERRSGDADTWSLDTFAYAFDVERTELLNRRGYSNAGLAGYARRRSLDEPIAEVGLPTGYSVRTIRVVDTHDLTRLATVNNATFGGFTWTADTVRVLARAPTYRQDLDLVAVAPDGSFAAFLTAWFDETNRIGAIEPVGTGPGHRRLGLARSLLHEGMRRLRTMGATTAHLGSGPGAEANRFYGSVGFTNCEAEYRWRKDL